MTQLKRDVTPPTPRRLWDLVDEVRELKADNKRAWRMIIVLAGTLAWSLALHMRSCL